MKYNHRLLLKGNEAAVYGALLAGCDCYFGYPITPASEIAQAAALLFPKLNRTFVQAESEIGAINMVIGASSVGHRCMTASSGLGISLKQEGVSYLAGYEIPAVILDITRGGPGLGNIGPEQADYFQVVKGGGHGSYCNFVFTPNSVQEMCDMTVEAFRISEKYRMTAYVMADGVIGQMMESVELPEPATDVYDPEWKLGRYVDGKANIITSLYMEHDDLEAHNEKLQRKYREVEAKEQSCETYRTDDAELVIVAYGICSRIGRGAVDQLRAEGIKAGLLRPRLVWPFPVDALRKIVSDGNAKALMSLEMSAGQMIEDIKLAVECKLPVFLCNRMGGNVPGGDEVCAAAKKIMKELSK
ncbi:MAG: 3-methyl-2-oxobutanoate dehydrogenase subunit VorB [Victivallaceae bacterium]|nr:3-methyl-2-oxobutanoate dehydrogenase subunit VorB [Victivallaceae bacterium]